MKVGAREMLCNHPASVASYFQDAVMQLLCNLEAIMQDKVPGDARYRRYMMKSMRAHSHPLP